MKELNKVFNILLRDCIVEIVLSGLNTLNDLNEAKLTELFYNELCPGINYPLLS